MREKNVNILIFEDSFESMVYLKKYLEDKFGWSVVVTAAESLLDSLKTERFDLVIVDIMIRSTSGNGVSNVHFDGVHWKRTGIEFVMQLRRGMFSKTPDKGTQPSVPIIALTAVGDEDIIEHLKEYENVDYAEKPFRLDELIDKIRKVVNR